MPTIYGLPKTHKHNILIISIISRINSPPPKLAKTIAKIQTPFLATIRLTHIKPSVDLIQSIKIINEGNKVMADLVIKSLETIILVYKIPQYSQKSPEKIQRNTSSACP